MTPSADRRPEGARAPEPSAADLWGRARGSVDLGRPGTGYRLGSRALTHLGREHLPEAAAAALRARILVTMADAQVELGADRARHGVLSTRRWERAPPSGPWCRRPAGCCCARTGRLEQALEQLDAGVAGLVGAGGPGPT